MKPSPKRLVNQALKRPPLWAGCDQPHDIMMGMAARIVRNLADYPFPGWSTEASRQKVFEQISPALLSNEQLRVRQFIEMPKLGLHERRALLDRKLISPCMAARQAGCYIGMNSEHDTILMINEEEHLVAHCFAAGSFMQEAYNGFRNTVESLDKSITFAKTPGLGYLVSAPAEAGDGMQLYCILHLPGIYLAGMSEQVQRAAEKLSLSFTPLHVNNEEISGNCYMLGAGPARLGKTDLMFGHLRSVAEELIEREWQIRQKLLFTKPYDTFDVIGRSYGLLLYAHKLSYAELQRNLSHLRLGLSLGLMESAGTPYSDLQLASELIQAAVDLSPGTISLTPNPPAEDEQDVIRAQQTHALLTHTCIDFLSPFPDSITTHE